MKIQQAIETSCMRGIEDKSGVCLYSMSRELNPISKERFKAASIYENDYRYQGTIEELPIRFFTGVDEMGAFYIQQVKSIKDYTPGGRGRMGNILSQMFLIEKGQGELELPPVCYYMAPEFYREMEEKSVCSQEKPDYLPALDKLTPNKNLTFEKITSFIEKEGVEKTLHLIATALTVCENRKRLIICDTPERIVQWIAAIQFSLPAAVNRELRVSTYTYDIDLAQTEICGYVKGVSRESNGWNYQRYEVFDGQSSMALKGDITYQWFINLKMSFLTKDYEDYIQRFNTFLEKHEYNCLSQEIYLAYEVYSMLESGTIWDESHFQIHQICEFAGKWLHDDEKCKLVQNILSADLDGRINLEVIKDSCCTLLLDSNWEAAIQTLNRMDEKNVQESAQGAKRVNEYCLDAIWKNYLGTLCKRIPQEKEKLYGLLQENVKRTVVLMESEMENPAENPFTVFQNYFEKLQSLGICKELNQSQTLLIQKYETFIFSRYAGDERWGRNVELLVYLLQKQLYGGLLDAMVQKIDQRYPVCDTEINRKNRALKSGKTDKLKRQYGEVELDLHKVAADILNYQFKRTTAFYCGRSNLYLLGYSLIRFLAKNEDFDFYKEPSLMRDCFYKEPIDITLIAPDETEGYFQWIMPVLHNYCLDERRIEFLFHCFIMHPQQKEIVVAALFQDIYEDYARKTDYKELVALISYCANTEPEIYRRGLSECLLDMKKNDYKHLGDWMETYAGRRRDALYGYWEAISVDKQEKGSILGKLFGKKDV